jgi:hypothetical protein
MSLRLSILVGSLITVSLWLLVLASAWSFHVWASDYFAETGSVNAGNDLGYSWQLLVASGVGSIAALACGIWLVLKRSAQALAVEIWAACYVVAFFTGDHAHPIHLFPTGGPLLLTFAATGLALAITLMVTHLATRGRLPNKMQQPTGASSGADG